MWLQFSLPESSAQWPHPSDQAASRPSPAAHPRQQHHTHPWGASSSSHSTGTLCPPFPVVAALTLVEERNRGEFLCSIWLFALQWLQQKDPAPALSRAPATEATTQGLSLYDFPVAKMATKAVLLNPPWPGPWAFTLGMSCGLSPCVGAGKGCVWQRGHVGTPCAQAAPLTEPW